MPQSQLANTQQSDQKMHCPKMNTMFENGHYYCSLFGQRTRGIYIFLIPQLSKVPVQPFARLEFNNP